MIEELKKIAFDFATDKIIGWKATNLVTPPCMLECHTTKWEWFSSRFGGREVTWQNGLYVAKSCFDDCVSKAISLFKTTVNERVDPTNGTYVEYVEKTLEVIETLVPDYQKLYEEALDKVNILREISPTTCVQIGIALVVVGVAGTYFFTQTCRKPDNIIA